MAKSADEVLKEAQEALRKRQAEQKALEDSTEPPAEVPALQGTGGAPVPFPDLSQYQASPEPGGDAAPALEQAQAALSKAQQERGLTPESEKSVWTDIKTTAKIAALYPVVGKLARGEQEMGLRELTKNLVLDQIPDEDKAGLEALAKAKFKKGLGDLKWRELDRIAGNFYRSSDMDWRERLARMAGFRPGDEYWAKEMQQVEMGPDVLTNKPGSGTPAFPMARELIEGSIQTGVGNFYEDFIRPVFSNDTPELAEEMVQAIQQATEGYRAETKASLEKPMVAEEAIWYDPTTYFDEGTKDPYHDLSAFLHTAVQQSGNIVGMAIASRLGGGAGARYAMRRFGGGLDKFEDIQRLQKRGATIGGGTAGGAAEMSLIRDAVFSEAHQRISNDIKDEVWANDATYQRLVDGGLTPTEAKQIIAYEHANNAGNLAMLVSGALMGTPMGMFYGSLTGTSAGRTAAKESILRSMTKGALYETGQEMAQELSEQIASNLAVMKVDPNQDLFEGGLEAVVTAGLISGPYGAIGGIRGEQGAGIAKAKDTLIRNVQPWVNAATERHKYQTKVGPDTKFAKDASPQEQLKAVVELERLQKKEAEEWLKHAEENRRLMQETGAGNKELVEFDARTAGYETDLAFIAKRQKARVEAKAQQREERAAQKERAEAKAQVERDVGTINDNMRMVEQMTAVQKGEALDLDQYEELRKLGYGTFTGRGDSNFVLTERGVRAMRELAKQANDLRNRIDAGDTGPERRTRQQLREAYDDLTDEEFEEQVMKDPQTKLWNKRKMEEDLRDKTWGGAAFVDADALKWVNENMSYSAGDEYLRTITRELEGLGGGIEVYRRGGDEFVILGPSEEIVQAEVEKAIRRINNAPPLVEAGKSVKVAVSTGYGPSVGVASEAMKEEKQRRIETGQRADTRIEGAVPPSLSVANPDAANSPQMSLFALAANSSNWDDDKINSNGYGNDMWGEYVRQADFYWGRKMADPEPKRVDDEHFRWIEEAVKEFLPDENTNNPPITIVHDYAWLKELAPNQYRELMDLPFGAKGVRGLFSLDDPTHGVFLMADVILAEARSGLRKGQRITTWSSAKYTFKPGTYVEVIDGTGKVRYGTVKVATYKRPYYQPTTRETAQERRLGTEAIKARKKLDRLAKKEINLMKQHVKMSAEKKRDINHPLNRQLSRLFDQIGEAQFEFELLRDEVRAAREERWTKGAAERKAQLEKQGDLEEDKVIVEMPNGAQVTFDPVTNKATNVSGDLRITAGEEQIPDLHIGRYRGSKNAATWTGNLGNVPASQDEPLTKERVQRVAADTVMHETVGHYGIRGITQDWNTYLNLSHAIVDAFPELAENLRLMGYNYRDDLKRGEHLNAANKALLGEEIMAWLAGNRTSAVPNMNVTQRNAFSRFLTWIKTQLLNMGFNRLYRRMQAAQIRKARRKYHNAIRSGNMAAQDAAFEELYGNGEEPGLVYVGRSGVRKSKWDTLKKKYTGGGRVVRAAEGFLNEDDLLNIVQRSLDFTRNGKQRWKFVDHHGNRHFLPMRDIEIFRKPVTYVMEHATRPRTEEEKITEKDLEPLPVVPSEAEVYELLAGEPMPDNFKILSPADFKDEAKRIREQMSEGKTPEEIKEMGKKKMFPNPKELFDQATEHLTPAQIELGNRITSEIHKVTKEREFRENALAKKKHNINLLEKRWGKEAVDNDEIPLFPDVGSVNDFINAAKAALPSGSNYITDDELWASGLIEALYPSRFYELFRDGFVDVPSFTQQTGITEERIAELKTANTQMTPKEAKAVTEYLQNRNEMAKSDPSIDTYPEFLVDERVIMQNNGLTARDFRMYVSGYNLSGRDADLATLIAVFGDGSKYVRLYEDAMKMSDSNDPDIAAQGRTLASEILFAPVDVTKTDITKDWVLNKIKQPQFEVSVEMSTPLRDSYDDSIDLLTEHFDFPRHYKRITGVEADANWSTWRDIPDEGVRDQVYRALMKDVREGPDIGYDPILGEWVPPNYDNHGQTDYPNLMVPWIVPGSFQTYVFWQRPHDGVQTHHMGWAKYRGSDRTGPGGIWGHTRVAAVEDADPNAPTAPNPSKQGQAFFPFEFQSDAFQAQAKMYTTSEEANQAAMQRRLDGMMLTEGFNHLSNHFALMSIDKFSESWNSFRSNITEEDVINDMFEGDDRQYNQLAHTEKQIFADILAAKRMVGGNQLTPVTVGLQDAINRVRVEARDVGNTLRSIATGEQPNQNMQAFIATPGQQIATDIKFIGDARNFEYMDERAIGQFLEGWLAVPQGIEAMVDNLRGIDRGNYTGSSYYQALKEAGGFMRFLTTGIKLNNYSPNSNHALARNLKSSADRYASASDPNQPAHRIPWMKATVTKRIAEVLDFSQVRQPRGQSYEDMAKNMIEQAYDMHLYKITVDYEQLSDVLSSTGRAYSGSDIYSWIENFANNATNMPFWNAVEDNHPNLVINVIAKGDEFEKWQQNFLDQYKAWMAVQLNVGNMSDTRRALRTIERKMQSRWYNLRDANEIQQWKSDFQLVQAELKITDDEANPFAHANIGMAGNLDIQQAQEMLTNHGAERFDEYVARKWARAWPRFSDERRAEVVAQGGSEDTASPEFLENYLERYNDSTPSVITGKVPIEWDQQSNATDWVDLTIVRKQPEDGDAFQITIGGESLGAYDRYDIQNTLGQIIHSYYRHYSSLDAGSINPWKFPSLRPQIREWKAKVKEYQARIDEGERGQSDVVEQLFADQSMHPTIDGGKIKEPAKAFDRIIKYQKKRQGHARPHNIMYEKWKSAQMLWSISEAVRQGYSRIHLAPGDVSAPRGGQQTSSTAWWHHANQIQYELTQREVRGSMRDIMIVKGDTVSEAMWIDVTESKLAALHEYEDTGEPSGLNDRYMSVDLARELGRDVAEVIAQKLRETHTAPTAQRLLVSGHEDQWFVHEPNGTVLSQHPSRRAAQNARRAVQEGETEAPIKSYKGSVTSHEVGGSIMFLKTRYGGSTQFAFTSENAYQHTLARPWFAGLRDNYDRELINTYRAYLKSFGLDVEAGYVKIADRGEQETAVYSHGMRRKHSLSPDFARMNPNIRVEEVGGETVGYVLMSDNGSLDNIIYRAAEEADAALADIMRLNSVTEDGMLKVYQVTINDKLREAHEKPINPYMTVKAQLRGNKHLDSLLSKIGSDEPSLIDRFKAWRKSWRAHWNQGMFDRFYGIRHALDAVKATLNPEEDGYILARMSTGLDAMMRSVMEYGWPVWRNGVVEAEGKGLLKILEPVSSELETWAAYMVGKRSKRLIMEGYDKLDPEEQATLNAAARVFDGSNDRERVFRMLAYASGYRPDVMPKATRREFMKMMGGVTAAASAGLPTSSDADQKALEIVGEALKGRPKKDAGRLLKPRTRFRNPEQAKYAMQKQVMDQTGVDKDEAKRAIDRAINQKLEDQKIADAARRNAQAVTKRSAEMDAALDDAGNLLDKLLNQGREKLVNPAEAAAGVDLVNSFPMFEQVAAEYAKWNSKLLDFAQEAGVINAETRPLWENADYIPFYRIADDRIVGPLAKGNGISDVNSPIKTLKGGTNNLGDLIHNIFMNATNLVDAAVKNNAALKTVDALEPSGMVRKIGLSGTQALIDLKEVGKILKMNGIDPESLPEEVTSGLRMMFALEAPSGEGVIAVMRDGKKEYYKTEDELLYRAMSAINMENFGNWMNLLRAPKRLLTTMVTLDPGFMLANFVRDSMSGWVLSRDQFVPLYGGLKGFAKALVEDETMRTMISSGSAFDSGFINQGDPKSTHRYIKAAMRDAGFQRTVLNTPRKLFEAWKRIGSATENANRIAVYEAAIRAGKSKLQALYEAKDLMDFSMGGDWPFIQFLIQTVPFMGARMQGLQRLGRGAAENPLAFTMKGSLIGLAGLALWFAFRDDERYKALQPWDKDTYFHWWIGDTHYRLPKGFEVGSIFNTIPERFFEYMYSKENDAGRFLMRRYGYMIAETFNMNPIPQTIRPLVESFANFNFFTGNMIESPWEAERLPEDRYRYYTSPTMIELAAHMPDGLDTVLNGKIKSPLHLQNLYSGYTGTLGRYFLMASDVAIRELFDYPVPPERMLADYPVIGRMYRGTDDEPRRTKYEEEFYRELTRVNQVMNSLSFSERELRVDDPRFEEIEKKYRPYVELADQYRSDARAISDINKEIRSIYTDMEMDAKEKRRQINELQKEKNAIFKEAVQERPSAMDPEDIGSIIDNFVPTTPQSPTELMERAPMTAQLVEGVANMSDSQLQRLARSANYSPRNRDAAEA